MSITAIYAHLSCAELGRSRTWYAILLGREPDSAPMPGLVEWHQGESAGFQLFENAADAGRGTVTLLVDGIEDVRRRLLSNGVEVGELEKASFTTIARLQDPDGNLVVLAQPQDATGSQSVRAHEEKTDR